MLQFFISITTIAIELVRKGGSGSELVRLGGSGSELVRLGGSELSIV